MSPELALLGSDVRMRSGLLRGEPRSENDPTQTLSAPWMGSFTQQCFALSSSFTIHARSGSSAPDPLSRLRPEPEHHQELSILALAFTRSCVSKPSPKDPKTSRSCERHLSASGLSSCKSHKLRQTLSSNDLAFCFRATSRPLRK